MNKIDEVIELTKLSGEYVRLPSNCSFARKKDSFEIGVTEIVDALQYFPICVRTISDTQQIHILCSLSKEENYYVLPNSNWAVSYVPRVMKCYPFVIRNDEDNDQLLIYNDAITRHKNPIDEFINIPPSDSNESDKLNSAKQMLLNHKKEVTVSRTVAKVFSEIGILKSWHVKDGRVADSKNIENIQFIDEKRLQNLPPDLLSQLSKRGYLGIAYAMVLSERRFSVLKSLAQDTEVLKPLGTQMKSTDINNEASGVDFDF